MVTSFSVSLPCALLLSLDHWADLSRVNWWGRGEEEVEGIFLEWLWHVKGLLWPWQISWCLGSLKTSLHFTLSHWILFMSFIDVDECIFGHDHLGVSCHSLRILAVPAVAFCCCFVFVFCFPSRKLSFTGSKMTLPLLDPHLVYERKMHIWDSLSIGMVLFFKPWLLLCCSGQTRVLLITQSHQTYQSALSLKLQRTHFKLPEWSYGLSQSPYS